MNDTQPGLFPLDPCLDRVDLDLFPLLGLHLIALPLVLFSPLQLPHLKHQPLLRPHLHQLPRQRVLHPLSVAVGFLDHVLEFFDVALFEALDTGGGGRLVVGHVVVPGAGELDELEVLLLLDLLKLLELCRLHVLLLPLKLTGGKALQVVLRSRGLSILQRPLTFSSVLIQTPKRYLRKICQMTYLMKSRTLKSGMK